MNNSNIAKKHGIIEQRPMPYEIAQFYTSYNIKEIEDFHVGYTNLICSGYTIDEDEKNYIKTNNFVSYEFNGVKHDLYEYEDCFIYYVYICNKKLKKFKHICISDYKGYNGSGIYIYKNKYFCFYDELKETLTMLNRNESIIKPSPAIMADLKIADSNIISKFCTQNSNQPKSTKFWDVNDDETIFGYFDQLYIEIMKNLLKSESQAFKKYTEFLEIKLHNITGITRFNTEKLYLLNNKEFRDFCNGLCRFEDFNKKLLNNPEIKNDLKNNFWICHEFSASLKNPKSNYIQGEDFSFLILNAIKALEYLLYKKSLDYENSNENNNEVEITEKAMLNKLINYINKNRKTIIKTPNTKIISENRFNSFVDSYIKLLIDVKDNCRNGYFHKHRLHDLDDFHKKREKVLEAIAQTIILLK